MASDYGPETKRRIELMFTEVDRTEAVRLLSQSDLSGDRVCIAAIKKSGGTLAGLQEAIKIGEKDWRDLLLTAGFTNDTRKHLSWLPGQVEKSWWSTLVQKFGAQR